MARDVDGADPFVLGSESLVEVAVMGAETGAGKVVFPLFKFLFTYR